MNGTGRWGNWWPMSEQPQLYWYRAQVKELIDGDTVVLDVSLGFDVYLKDQHIRLAGINTPEPRGEERDKGIEASDYLACLLPPVGGEVLIRTTKDKRGSFHRMLADIYVNGMHVNRRMVEEGYAEDVV